MAFVLEFAYICTFDLAFEMNRLLKIFSVLALFFAFAPGKLAAQYDKDVFYLRGRQSLSDGKYTRAIENFNILARLDTTDYWTFFFRGIAKYNLGDVRGAQADFDTSVRLNPVFTNGYHYRAITESRSGEYEKAFRDFDSALALRPGYEGIYFSRGVTYFLTRQFDSAVSDFDRYIRRQPKDPSAYLNRGASYLFLGDTLKAVADYDKAISLDRFDPEGYMRRGSLYASGGDYEKGIADMNKAIELDSTVTLAYFNRALMYYETKDFNSAMADLDRVLAAEPGNALTLYNRSLINAQVGNFEAALSDMDRVININPNNVLAYFNRASFFVQMDRMHDALEDYDKAIDLYPDFAKAYQNRSYVESRLGMAEASKRDYDTALSKIREYEEANRAAVGSFADTTRKYSSLIALDADFAKKDFDDELLQHRDIDIRLKPLYRFVITRGGDDVKYALRTGYENALIDRFRSALPVPVAVTNVDSLAAAPDDATEALIYGREAGQGISEARLDFLKALYEVSGKQYNSALNYYGKAADAPQEEGYEQYYRAFYLNNRAVLRADMIDFIASMESNVQTLSMDDKGTTRARVKDRVTRTYDYSEAIGDLQAAAAIVGDLPYVYYNLGNLYCLSSQLVESIGNYTRAIELYPYMGDAYYNRGLVLIYLKDKEKGCIDLSRAGELGVAEAYSVINKYCEEKN